MTAKVTTLLLFFLLSLGVSCSDPAAKLPRYDRVPRFAMTDSQGRLFTNRQMTGAVWVVDFIYTTCPAECPRMSAQMRKVEKQFEGERDVQFLSISVDPDRDTPAVLDAFARRWGGPNAQWTFLTGNPETVHLLANTTFHVGDVINKIEHSTRFAVVDRSGFIRGYYSSFDPDGLRELAAAVEALRRSRA